MNTTRRKAIHALFAAWAAVFANAVLGEAGEKLVLTGSSTMAPLMAEIGKRYEERHPDWRVDVQSGGSSRGINDARGGLADIGMVSRALKDEEDDLESVTVALDGIGMIVHRDNAVLPLTDRQIVEIYTGKRTNWKEVGGSDMPITVVGKAEGRSTLELFLSYFGLQVEQLEVQVVIGDNQQGIKTVAANPGAIGYVSIGSAEYEIARGAPLRLLSLRGVEASTLSVRERRYPLARPLNLVTKLVTRGGRSAAVESLLAFSRSAEVRDLLTAQFFVEP